MINKRIGKLKLSSLLNFILVFSLLFSVMRDNFGFPSILRYIIDLIMISLMLVAIRHKKFGKSIPKFVSCWFTIYMFFVIIVCLVYFVSPLYFINGFSKTFRFPLYFILCIIYISSDDIDRAFVWIDILFYVNFFVTIFQFFVLGIYGDNLGGIFGTIVGCNGSTNVFLVACSAITIMNYIHNKEKMWIVIIKIGMIMLIATLASIKFFFIEFLIGGLLMILYTNFSFKKLLILVSAGLVLILGMYMVDNLSIYAGNRRIFSIAEFVSYSSSGYSGVGTVDRMIFIPFINERFLTDPLHRLFGLGLGNCDYAGFDLMTSNFYKKNYLSRYYWIASAHIYLEQGYMGFAIYLLFYIYVVVHCLKKLKINKELNYYGGIVIFIAFESVLILFYNQSIRQESAFILFYLMALPFAFERIKKRSLFLKTTWSQLDTKTCL